MNSKICQLLCVLLLMVKLAMTIPTEQGVKFDINPETSLSEPSALSVKKSSSSNNVAIVITDDQKVAIVQRHNKLRSEAQPTATKMLKMTWDSELADLATQYSRQCIYKHNKKRTHSRFKSVGENLYVAMGYTFTTLLLEGAVSAWDAEKSDYTFETRECVPGKMCGHYTQVVWDDSFKVGCGITKCSKIDVRGKIWTNALLYVCNYGPAGNYPRQPFTAGASCTNCHKTDVCVNNLCTNTIRDNPRDSSLVANWNEWSPWSTCSKTCFGGLARRQRTCNTFVEGDCKGDARQITPCSFNFCNEPNNGFWDPWGSWSSCSRSCGVGKITKSRKCKPNYICNGPSLLSMDCNILPCPETSQWVGWGRWQACSQTCGTGIQKRKRTCSHPAGCSGSSDQTKTCNRMSCDTSSWSPWTAWTKCSVTCGGGQISRSRRCKTGKNCEGPLDEVDVCSVNRCPGSWTTWSDWSSCTKSCGGGTKTRSRKCRGGNECGGAATENLFCNVDDCPKFGRWSKWSDCDVTCGKGRKSRNRECSTGNPGDCPGKSTMHVECSRPKCVNTEWNQWSEFGECSKTCGGGTKSSIRTCNIGTSGSDTCVGLDVRMSTCNIERCPEYMQWGPWSVCDVICGEGTRTRTRECGSKKAVCSGKAIDVQSCHSKSCTKSKWQNWMDWSKCSRTCGEGFQTRKRVCDVGSVGPPCAGVNLESRPCTLKACSRKVDDKDPPNQGPLDRKAHRKTVNGTDTTTGPGGGAMTLAIRWNLPLLLSLTSIIFVSTVLI